MILAEAAQDAAQIEWGAVLNTLISAAGGAFGAFLLARGKRREDTQTLVDQLQEERVQYVGLLREEREMNERRLDRMWDDKAASRQHVAELRAHIFKGSPPPPPAPPAGYIE